MSQPIEPTTSRILFFLDTCEEFQGTQRLTLAMNFSAKCKPYVLRMVRRLADSGEITISKSNGGAGKRTVYKRNRNQPGMARKVTR